MVITKKKTQVASFDPFLRDASGNPVGTRDPSPFFTGGGAVDAPVSGASTPEPVQKQPPLEGTFTDVKTGRPSGVSRGGQTFFVGGSDLSLFQQQQAEKNALSGGATGAARPLKDVIAESRAAETTFQQAQAGKIPFNPLRIQGIEGTLGRILGAADQIAVSSALERAVKGELSSEEAAALGLTPLDLQVLASGQAEVNDFAQIAEGFKLLGKIRFKTTGFSMGIADFLGKSPNTKVDELIRKIKKAEEAASKAGENSLVNPMATDQYRSQVIQIEQDMLILESRIKLIAMQSPAIQSNPDNLDEITTEIGLALGSLSQSKIALGIQ